VVVIFVSMTAFAFRSPSRDVEPSTPRKVVVANFLGPCWNKAEGRAITVLLLLLLGVTLLPRRYPPPFSYALKVSAKRKPAEASTCRPNATAEIRVSLPSASGCAIYDVGAG
jgi:hypothetical protein